MEKTKGILENHRNTKESYSVCVRRIRLFIDVPNKSKDELSIYYKRLYQWQDIAFRASNLVSSHLFFQERVKEFIYLNDGIKLKLIDNKKDPLGMLNTSFQNSTYRILSQKFKSELPSSIITCLNQSVVNAFLKEKNEYFLGERSIRSYKKNLPVPFSPGDIHNLLYDENIKNYRFSLFDSNKYKVPFRTYLGNDLSGNKAIITKCINGEYKLCQSVYRIEDGKIFLYLTVKIPQKNISLNPNLIAQAKLSFWAPIIVLFNNKEFYFGDKESYIYKRRAIQEGLKRRIQLMKYNSGGKGRKKKLQGIEEFKLKEKAFIQNFIHTLSKELVDFCINNNIGKLELTEVNQTIEEAKENPLVLRNWSFGSLINKIEYKCKFNKIELIKN